MHWPTFAEVLTTSFDLSELMSQMYTSSKPQNMMPSSTYSTFEIVELIVREFFTFRFIPSKMYSVFGETVSSEVMEIIA